MNLEDYNIQGIQRGLEQGCSDAEIAGLQDMSVEDVAQIRRRLSIRRHLVQNRDRRIQKRSFKDRPREKVQEMDKYYSTLHELPVCPLPVAECVWVSDDVGRVWLSPGEYFEFGEPMQKVRFIVYENAVLARKPHSSSVGFSLPQILADRNFCEGLSHIEARICPIRRNCQHSDTANTVRGRNFEMGISYS